MWQSVLLSETLLNKLYYNFTHPFQAFSVDEHSAEQSAENFAKHNCHDSDATEVEVMTHFF